MGNQNRIVKYVFKLFKQIKRFCPKYSEIIRERSYDINIYYKTSYINRVYIYGWNVGGDGFEKNRINLLYLNFVNDATNPSETNVCP